MTRTRAIRKALLAAFPNHVFSVRTIDEPKEHWYTTIIKWTSGPNERQVKAAITEAVEPYKDKWWDIRWPIEFDRH